MKKIIIYCAVVFALVVPVICLAITSDPFSGDGTQVSLYKVEWSNEIILSYDYVGFPNLSQDGKKIVFIKYKSENYPEGEIWIANSDGTDAKALLSEEYTDYKTPVWSPDGTKIVFLKNSAFEMWQINENGTGIEPLTEKKYEKMSPVWWPDGSKIIYYKGVPLNPQFPFEQFGLYILDFVKNSVEPLVCLIGELRFHFLPTHRPW